MALPKGTKRYQHKVTEEIRYFRNPPNLENWIKVGTPGSKNWKWVHNATEERYIQSNVEMPAGFSLGRLRI
jgi:hypothetical protein